MSERPEDTLRGRLAEALRDTYGGGWGNWDDWLALADRMIAKYGLDRPNDALVWRLLESDPQFREGMDAAAAEHERGEFRPYVRHAGDR